jgi:glyoxalase family protein
MKNEAFIHGIHHITAFSGDVNENIAFYTKILGLKLVKKSVNQDAPDIYHLFFADAHGSPGTDLTFFPFPRIAKAKDGYGIASEVGFAIPLKSYAYWKDRLDTLGVNKLDESIRFGEKVLSFEDPHGLQITLTATKQPMEVILWDKSEVPGEHQLRGFHTVKLKLHTLTPTQQLMTEIMGFRFVANDDKWIRYESGEGGSGTYVDIAAFPEESEGRWGYGGVHHVAWRVKDADTEVALRKKVAGFGLQPSPVIDRFWFESVYFKEPNGVLFELATDGPGFDRDEPIDKLGEELILPPWLESQREKIEAALPKITI